VISAVKGTQCPYQCNPALSVESVTMQQPDFPLFSSDKAARSWGCCACHSTNITATVGDENFPQGRGHYRY